MQGKINCWTEKCYKRLLLQKINSKKNHSIGKNLSIPFMKEVVKINDW